MKDIYNWIFCIIWEYLVKEVKFIYLLIWVKNLKNKNKIGIENI